MTWNVDKSRELYNIEGWSNGYFGISEAGNLEIRPEGPISKERICFKKVISEIKDEGIQFPIVLRFHDILRARVRDLNITFSDVIKEYEYAGRFQGVYPIKVNQMREVVEEIVEAGNEFDYGLEAGSKAELMAVLAYNTNKNSLTILNGYKDEEYLRLALLGRKLGRKIVIVIEKFSEVSKIINLSKKLNVEPLLGVRSKMTVKGRGKWESSSGEKAKFGLSSTEIIQTINELRKAGLLHSLKLLHFHIGSQVTDIRAIKEAMNEGARLYTEIVNLGVNLEYFDVGGGLGVDYDGSSSTNDSSINYGLREYVSDIVYSLKQICDLASVKHPTIVTESGRAITAHHSCVVTNIIGEINNSNVVGDLSLEEDEHILLQNMRELEGDLKKESNLSEAFNDAQMYKSDAINAFKLGVVSLSERAKIETLYWKIVKKINNLLSEDDIGSELQIEIESLVSSQYLCNFSVFQSAADSWAIDQVLPVSPITRLHERPSVNCSLADITCDSDGKMDSFVDCNGEKTNTIKLHPLNGDDYYIGIFLTGAYQDVMGDMHNLFGRLNEVHIYAHSEEKDGFYIEEIVKGSRSHQVLQTMQYNPEYMALLVKKSIDEEISNKEIAPREGVKLIDFYESCLESYTYLN